MLLFSDLQYFYFQLLISIFQICFIILTIKSTSHISKNLYYVIVIIFNIIMHKIEKNTYFHHLNIILLYFPFFYISNPIIHTKPKSIFILILIPFNNHNLISYTILKIIKFSIPDILIFHFNILLLEYFNLKYISQILIYFYPLCNPVK
jgi:hypothetical protein